MMPKFSQSSLRKLETCDGQLYQLFTEVVKTFDCTIVTGHRNKAAQNEKYQKGLTTVKYPNSKHNVLPAQAVDAAPYPIDWDDADRFYYFAGYVKGIAQQMGIAIRWGGDWDQDTETADQKFNDLGHFELVKK